MAKIMVGRSGTPEFDEAGMLSSIRVFRPLVVKSVPNPLDLLGPVADYST
jgi:hypothetical protein